VAKSWQRQQIVAYATSEPGAYRVEAFVPYYGQRRGWIYSNPIFVKSTQ
jgi:hypothetical protein